VVIGLGFICEWVKPVCCLSLAVNNGFMLMVWICEWVGRLCAMCGVILFACGLGLIWFVGFGADL
jgi:hypothetical protein